MLDKSFKSWKLNAWVLIWICGLLLVRDAWPQPGHQFCPWWPDWWRGETHAAGEPRRSDVRLVWKAWDETSSQGASGSSTPSLQSWRSSDAWLPASTQSSGTRPVGPTSNHRGATGWFPKPQGWGYPATKSPHLDTQDAAGDCWPLICQADVSKAFGAGTYTTQAKDAGHEQNTHRPLANLICKPQGSVFFAASKRYHTCTESQLYQKKCFGAELASLAMCASRVATDSSLEISSLCSASKRQEPRAICRGGFDVCMGEIPWTLHLRWSRRALF